MDGGASLFAEPAHGKNWSLALRGFAETAAVEGGATRDEEGV